jgi:hypothetical protein
MTNRTDNFNRANTSSGQLGTPSDGGSAWLEPDSQYSWDISSNAAKTTPAIGWNADALESSISDCDVQATLLGTVNYVAGICGRLTSQANYIEARVTAGVGYNLWARVAGTDTQIGTTYSASPGANEVVKLHMSGTTIEMYVNGTKVAYGTSSANQTATKHGIFTYGDNVTKFDNFSITGFGSSSYSPSLLISKMISGGSNV